MCVLNDDLQNDVYKSICRSFVVQKVRIVDDIRLTVCVCVLFALLKLRSSSLEIEKKRKDKLKGATLALISNSLSRSSPSTFVRKELCKCSSSSSRTVNLLHKSMELLSS